MSNSHSNINTSPPLTPSLDSMKYSSDNSLYDSDCLHCLPCKIGGNFEINNTSSSKEMMKEHFKIINCPDSNKIESSFRGRKIVGDCSTLIDCKGILLDEDTKEEIGSFERMVFWNPDVACDVKELAEKESIVNLVGLCSSFVESSK